MITSAVGVGKARIEGNGSVGAAAESNGAVSRFNGSAGELHERSGTHEQNGSAGASPSRSASPSQGERPFAERKATIRKRKAWQPEQRDHLVYQWIRFEGKRQWWVATQLNIDQATVSRILIRYEKWLAHAQPGANGRLDPAERQRVQRWLTYERNEQILTSALRIAGEMEGFTDVSKSVVSHPMGTPSAEHEMRTEHSVLDRSGVAARFLRLAFRINMEQLKLVEMEPLEPLEPEWEEVEADDGDVVAEGESGRGGEGEGATAGSSSSAGSTGGQATRGTQDGEASGIEHEEEDEGKTDEEVADKTQRLKLHNVHNGADAKNGASEDADGSCANNGQPKKMRETCNSGAPPPLERSVIELPTGLVFPGNW